MLDNFQFRGKPVQDTIVPSNILEKEFLKEAKFYKRNENLVILKLHMESAMKDLGLAQMDELMNPTKEIREERQVAHSMPGEKTLQMDTVVSIRRVPLDGEELAQYYLNLAKELQEKYGPAPVNPSKKNKTTKAKTGSKKGR